MVCRERTYTIIEVSPPMIEDAFIFIDESAPSISLITNEDADIGIYSVVMNVALLHYPSIQATETFFIEIEPCIVNSFITNNSIITPDDQYIL